MSISIRELMRLQALEQLVAAQGARIEALEQRLAGARAACNREQPEPLRLHNAGRKADATRLDKAIAALLVDHPRAAELTAAQIRQALEVDEYRPLPSERTVRLHLAAIRGSGNGNADRVAAQSIASAH